MYHGTVGKICDLGGSGVPWSVGGRSVINYGVPDIINYGAISRVLMVRFYLVGEASTRKPLFLAETKEKEVRKERERKPDKEGDKDKGRKREDGRKEERIKSR